MPNGGEPLRSELVIKFVLDDDYKETIVDAEAYIDSIYNLSKTFNLIKGSGIINEEVEIYIKPIKTGSPEILTTFIIAFNKIQQLITPENIKNFTQTFFALFSIYKLMKKGEIDRKTITNYKINIGDKEIYIDNRTFNLYLQGEKYLDKFHKEILLDKKTKSISISDKKDLNYKIDRAEIEKFIINEKNIKEKYEQERTILSITEDLSFNPKHKWTFRYNHKVCSFKITDENFLKELQSRKPISRGDKLLVLIEKRLVWDDVLDDYKEKEFTIIEAKLIPESKKEPLF